ncbi:uncharacterized protein LOC116248434 isoform X2 [Nymphaea colorata]|uniref:uncharacterized protein LOC116248434 isoform X2 n=1 Tax=Nymphaea colorata TaxID=210225 RepID=UPI00129ECB5C|nr:uncharacterized protein LOC116248434 isoform X2 [Nymphaea colorata]
MRRDEGLPAIVRCVNIQGRSIDLQRGTAGKKGSQQAERVRIKQQIRELRGVLPNSSKPDMVSVLVEAIDYVKLLQSEVRAMMMRNSLQDGVSTVGLQCLQHPHFPVGPLEVPMALGTNQRMHFGHGCPGMGCYSSVPPLHSSTAHHYISGASTLPWLHQLPTFPMHVTQLHHPPIYLQQAGPLPPCKCRFVLADARTWSCPVNSLVPHQEAEAQQEESVTTMTSASTE